jgi:Ca2+-binding RTX toxin-like protein
MTWRALPLVALTLLAAAPAHAAMVSVAGGTLTVTAAAGETNAVGVDHQSATYFVRDTGAPPSAGPGCRLATDEVQCPDSGITAAAVDLGDGDDNAGVSSFELTGVDVTLHGGPGNDSLSGPGHLFGDDGRDVLHADDDLGAVLDGGPGDDRLQDGNATDQLFGGDGDDELLGGEGDLLVGGPGYDEIEVTGQTATLDCEGRDDDAVQLGMPVMLRNCLPAPVIKVRTRRVSMKRFLRTGLPIDVSCDHDCAVGFFLMPGTCPTHGTGSTLSHRNPPRTRSGFVKPAGATAQLLATAGGPATRKAMGHLKGCKPQLRVVAVSRDGTTTTRNLSVRVGKP